jgi:hypothetical protein
VSTWEWVLEAALFVFVAVALVRTPAWWRYETASEAELLELAATEREREYRARLRRYRARKRRRARARRKHEVIPTESRRGAAWL